MTFLSRAFRRVRNFATGQRNNDRLAEEIAWHLAMQTDENIRAGMTPEEAARQARVKFGAVEAVRQDYHAERSLPFAEDLLADVRYALRVLRKSPAFTLVALATLMLGIGANMVVFGVVNAVLLRPLAVTDPPNLYQLRHQVWAKGRLLTTSYPAFEDFRRQNTTFSGMAGFYGYSQAKLDWHGAVKKISGYEVSGNYFDVLGVKPAVGRFFHAADEHGPDSAPFVVLSNALWRGMFQGDPGIVGTVVQLNNDSFTVVGVAPAQFHGTEQFVWPDYWIPMVNEAQLQGWDYLHNRASVAVTVLGRLKPGVTPQQATENLNVIAAGLAKTYPETDRDVAFRLIHPGLYGDNGDVVRGFLYSVTALALLVLTAACANLASLFAARVADRRRELALRIALGASRWRLVRQLLTEAMVVALAGGAAGLATAGVLLGMLNRWESPYGQLSVSVDAKMYATGLALTLVSALLCGLAPARQVLQSHPLQAMNGGAPVGVLPMRRLALRDVLLGVQIAICTLLVTASLVAARGMAQMLRAPLGFQPAGALLADVDLSQAVTGTDDAAQEKMRALLDAVRSIPSVSGIGTVNRVPMTGGLHGVPVFPPGTTDFKLSNAVSAPYVFTISPGYLDAAGTRLLTGRDVAWQDTAKTPAVAIVNATFARKLWRDAPAIGQRFIVSGRLTEVVGVMEDGKYHDMMESPQPVVYLPWSQNEAGGAIFVVRSPRAQNEMTAALERVFSSYAPDAPVSVQSWPDSLAGELFPARAATLALGVMGLLAAMLAVTGIFGMAAYNVSRRMKELGIRVALGASKSRVMRAAVGRPLLLLGAGSLLGLLWGLVSGPLLGRVVYQANPHDPLVLGGVVLTMVLLGLGATAIPAWRALAIDPAKLLRED